MTKETVVAFRAPEGFSPDPLTDLLRQGARQLIAQAVEAELNGFLASHADQTDAAGRRRLVRHGHLPEHVVQTGTGAVPVKVPRVRDRAPEGGRLKFTSMILPPYLRRAKSIEELLPWIYLKGISTGDFFEASAALLGPDAPACRPAPSPGYRRTGGTITSAGLNAICRRGTMCISGQTASISARVWNSSVKKSIRRINFSENDRQYMLVIIGADEWGNKDVLGLIDGFRESTQSWRELLLDLKHRGLELAPKLAVGAGAMKFWAALHEVYGKTRVQRCWVHKTANVLNTMPKSLQPKAKAHLKDIWMAETKAKADAAFDFFAEACGVKHDRAVKCLTKDRADLLAFHDFPAEHWKHIRTTNPIKSTFATVRHRTIKTKGCLSRQSALAMTHQLMLSAKKKWRKLDGQNRLPEIIRGVEFRDGIKHEIKAA